VCRLATIDDYNGEGSVPGGLLALHNLFVTLQYLDFLTALADSYDDYMTFLRGVGDPDSIQGVEFLQSVYENDIYYAMDKFGLTEGDSVDNFFQ